MALGIYVSVPFCRTKCSYCNFASDVFSRGKMQAYVDRLCEDLACAEENAGAAGGRFERAVETVYLGGGTPTILDPKQLTQIVQCIRREFVVRPEAEITVECAPGTLSDEMIECCLACGVNRVSLGTQSFVDQEARSVGRLHTKEIALSDVARLRRAGITNINLDLIAGLPHQTRESWEESLAAVIEANVPHVSVYMLEVDEDSRLGRELIAGGTRYHAHSVPDEELTVELYNRACERLENAGIAQYEISNFAKPGFESRHNLKYWTRQPYLGFGLDAHSMLASAEEDFEAVRFSTTDSLEDYLRAKQGSDVICNRARIDMRQAWEETFFLGLRLNRGVNLDSIRRDLDSSAELMATAAATILELLDLGLVEKLGAAVRLTPRGRLLSNEVFGMFVEARPAAVVEEVARELVDISLTTR